jgi:membrane-associated protease RseP (regulator of RpoE activity)
VASNGFTFFVGNTNQPQFEIASQAAPERHNILIHGGLAALTMMTMVVTGATWDAGSLWGSLDARSLQNGLLFAAALGAILAAHEFGHYFACRYYGVRATLPFFIPAPPAPLTPFGTFGALIKIKEPIRRRRALFDIGIAGPLAGFAVALPMSFVGLMKARAAMPPQGGSITFHNPPLFLIMIKLGGLPQWIEWNPIYWAAWAGLLVTALNLFPVGQLDGGHILYALAGKKWHKWTSFGVTLLVAALSIASMILHRSPIWFLWTVVLAFLTRVGHPPVALDEPLGLGRTILAALAAAVFLLCFLPFPITVSW